MSDNEKNAPAGRWKTLAAAAAVRGRKFLTPDLGKRTAVCLFMLFLLLCECISCYIGKTNTGSIVNPFIQGAWLYLAVFGLSLLPGGRATKILLTFDLALMGAVAAAGVFLHLRFALDMDCDCFFVLAASSTSEIGEFLGRFLTWYLIVILLVAAVSCGGMIALVWKTAFRRSYLNTAVALLMVLPFAINCIRYAADDELERIYTRSNLPRLISGYFVYRGKFAHLLNIERDPAVPSGVRMLPGGEKVVGVFVIGESAHSCHWGVYGYPRDTTPEIAKRRENCLIYDDAVAAIPHTTGALYHMLTDARLFNRKPAAFTMVDIFKAAGWRVVLISNQARWGKHDGPIGILTAHCDRRIYMNEETGHPYDMDILPFLKKELDGASAGRVLIIAHLMGSHQSFESRYPEGFSRFDQVRDQCNSGMKETHARELNEYDNSIAYTDQVLGKIMEQLENKSYPAFMLYCSDHSEIGDWGKYRNARASGTVIPEVYEVPLVLWSNAAYRQAFPEFVAGAARNVHMPLQTDRLIWSCLSASRITFDDFPSDQDIFSPRFCPAEKRPMGKDPQGYHPSAAKLAQWKLLRGAEGGATDGPSKVK